MSQPPPQSPSPWSWEPGQPPAGGAGASPGVAVPAQPLQYVVPQQHARPGLITAIGVISIVVASLSFVGSAFTVLQSAGYYMMSLMSSTVAAAQATATATAAVPPPVAMPEESAAGPRGMESEERQAAVRELTRLRPMTPSRKRHLDAILASAGRDMATDRVTDSGTMEGMRSGEIPPDYFVTPAGRLEVFNDRAVFYPIDRSPTVRASAPPEAAPGTAPGDEGAREVVDAPVKGVDPAPSTAPAISLTVPSTTTTAVVVGALAPGEVESVIQQAQSLSGNGLTPAQVASLRNVLAGPGQQLVQPGTAQGAVLSAYTQAGTPAVIQFSDGGSITLGQQGNVVSMAAAPVMPTFKFQPAALGLMLGTGLASLALAVYLLVIGILTLRQSPRGRRLHLIYAFIKIPLAIAAGVASAWVARDLMASFAGPGVPTPPTSGYSLFSGLMPLVLGCAYPAALLIVLNVKSVREYYNVDGGEAGSGPAR